jgi:ATP-dependent RNA helicase DeaD
MAPIVRTAAVAVAVILADVVDAFAPPTSHQPSISFLISERIGSTTSTTELHVKPKKPRFSQQVHKQQKAKPKSQKKPVAPPRQPWNSGKSIDDLENIMTQRWGTLRMDDDDDDGDELPFELEDQGVFHGSSSQKKKNGLDKRPAVIDPWLKEDMKKQKRKSATTTRTEFYDEDDEGYEYIPLDDDGDDGYSNGKLNVARNIAPKPVGGRGTKSKIAEKDNETGGGFFFNPSASSQPKSKAPSSKNDKKADFSEIENSRSKRKEQSERVPAVPLLDEDGDPILMTTDEAMRRFQAALPPGDETSELLFSEETPLIAATKSQSWDELGITSDILLDNLEEMDCPTPLDVQDKACPPILTGNDVLIGTYTGSGKTLAFLPPLVERLMWEENPGLAVIIVAPGRELASQITSVARSLIEGTDLSVQMAIGGTTYSRNLEQIRKRRPNILVGTPGRIAELVVGRPGEKSGKLKTNKLQALVMDEFDALLEYKPHREPTQAIMETLKRRHKDALQSILCSATASDIIDSSKVREFLRPGFAQVFADPDDFLVTDSKATTTARVSKTVLHGVIHVPHRRFVLDTIRRILHTEPTPQQILIFAENARKVDITVEKLGDMGIIAAPLHGGKGSDKIDRAEVSRALRDGYVGVVVATELAARGLDAPLLTHVINMDLPTDAPHYAHRAGRCGRGGRPGVVINITKSPKERNVPARFARELGIEMHSVEARDAKLIMVDGDSVVLD